MLETPRRLTAAEIFGMSVQATGAADSVKAARFLDLLKSTGRLTEGVVNYASSLTETGDLQGGEAALRLGLSMSPGDIQIERRLAFSLLRQGRFMEAWPLYERRPIQINANVTGKPQLSFPEWQGEPIRSLLVLPEQGLGDQIQFARLVRPLVDRGIDVTLICHPHLMRLLEPLGVRLLPAAGSAPMPRCDAWAMLMSLPFRLGLKVEDICGAPYLPSAAGGSGIGVMAQTRSGHHNELERSLSNELTTELLALPGAVNLDPASTGARDFYETARIIDKLADVVTIDTSVAHLAGAMGKPTWLLLPYVADWRWLVGRLDSPWYVSARLFRQRSPGEWRGPVDEIKAALMRR